jgi:recombination protein RecA
LFTKSEFVWFSYGEDKLGQGRNAVIGILEDNPDLLEEIEAKVVSQINHKESGTYELEDIL